MEKQPSKLKLVFLCVLIFAGFKIGQVSFQKQAEISNFAISQNDPNTLIEKKMNSGAVHVAPNLQSGQHKFQQAIEKSENNLKSDVYEFAQQLNSIGMLKLKSSNVSALTEEEKKWLKIQINVVRSNEYHWLIKRQAYLNIRKLLSEKERDELKIHLDSRTIASLVISKEDLLLEALND